MEKLLRCSACGFTTVESSLGDKCPKCGAARKQFIELSDEDAQKIYMSDRTNDIHMDIISLCMAINDLSLEGEELDLDPGCVDIFKKAQHIAWELKQMCKAEIATHKEKGKW